MFKNIKKLYLSRFFHNFVFAYVIERLFWQQRGMTALMVVYTEIIYAVVISTLEIPTGMLADKYSKKTLLIIADVLTIVELIIILYSYSFIGFAVAVFLAGISTALRSGTERAFLYESLKAENRQSEFEKCIGKLNAYDFAAISIAGLSGGVLANYYSFELNYYLSVISVTAALFFTASLKDLHHRDSTQNTPSFKKMFVSAYKTLKLKPVLTLIVFAFGVFSVATDYLDEFNQLYLNEIEFPLMFFGVFMLIETVVRIPGGLFAHKVLNKLKHINVIQLVVILAGIMMCQAAIFRGYVGLVLIILSLFLYGFAEPIVSGYLHHRVPSNIRATMDSTLSLVTRTLHIPIGLGFGYVVTRHKIFLGFGYLGLVLIVFSIIFLIIKIRLKETT